MKPIVHGLGRKYEGTIDFLYLNVGEPRTAAARRQLQFNSTPQIMLLNPDGTKFREWVGIVDELELTAGLDALLKATKKPR